MYFKGSKNWIWAFKDLRLQTGQGSKENSKAKVKLLVRMIYAENCEGLSWVVEINVLRVLRLH